MLDWCLHTIILKFNQFSAEEHIFNAYEQLLVSGGYCWLIINNFPLHELYDRDAILILVCFPVVTYASGPFFATSWSNSDCIHEKHRNWNVAENECNLGIRNRGQAKTVVGLLRLNCDNSVTKQSDINSKNLVRDIARPSAILLSLHNPWGLQACNLLSQISQPEIWESSSRAMPR